MENNERKQKGMFQEMYLLLDESLNDGKELLFHVIGSVGNIYKVTIKDNEWYYSCECPDHKFRKKKCKHVYFIEERVLKYNTGLSIYQKAFNRYQNKKKFIQEDSVWIPDINIQKKYLDYIIHDLKKGTRKRKRPNRYGNNEICGICMDKIEIDDDLVICEYVCQNRTHKTCFNIWKKSPYGSNICIYCRSSLNPPTIVKNDYI